MSDFADILDAVKDEEHLTHDYIIEILDIIAEADLSGLEEDDLLTRLATKSGHPKNVIRKELQKTKNKKLEPFDPAVSIANYVLEHHFNDGNLIIFRNGFGFYQYNSTHWKKISNTELKKIVLPIVMANPEAIGGKTANAVVSDTIKSLEILCYTHEESKAARPAINLKNKEIWFKESGFYAVKEHSADSHFFSTLPITYDDKATAPLYTETMLELFDACDEPLKVLRHWNEFLGYSIQPERFIPSVWFFIGGGQNGKSTAFKIIKELLQNSVYCCDIKKFKKDFFNSRALIDRLVIADEDYSEDLVLDTGFLKKISENSEISARSPHKIDTINFQNTALPILIGNHIPQCYDSTKGWKRRLYVFPFRKVFSDKEIDPERFNKIKATEMPGIINAALAGYARLRQRGHFDVPSDCKKAANLFFEQSNPLAQYLKERVTPALGNNAYIHLKDLKADFQSWSEEQVIPTKNYGNTLKSHIEKLDYPVGVMSGLNALKGYKFQKSSEN